MSKFKLWVDDANVAQNTQAYNTFVNDRQRESGFQAGEPASSIRVNTALRQSSLITVALMEVIAESDTTHDYTSTLASMKTLIEAGLKTVKVNNATQADTATSADNATNANNALAINGLKIIKDENGILKIGEIIIPQKKLLNVDIYIGGTYGEVTIYDENKTPSEANYFNNRTFEIVSGYGTFKFIIKNVAANQRIGTFPFLVETASSVYSLYVRLAMSGGNLVIRAGADHTFPIRKFYEILE